MSKAKPAPNQGQSGSPISLSFDQMNEDEKSIVQAIYRLQGIGPCKNSHVREACGWNQPDPKKGSSRVRNGLRRLVRGGWIVHTSDVGDGQYTLSDDAREFLNTTGQGPRPITRDQVLQVRSNPAVFEAIKRPDCSFYNACLQQAIEGNWPNFSCESCSAYAEPEPAQKYQDMLGLLALDVAADMVEKNGRLGRVRGVKAGPRANP